MIERLEANKALYRQLRDKLNTIGFGITYLDGEEELEYLGLMFSEEDAQYYLHVDVDYDTPEHVAEKLGLDAAEVSAHLKDMSLRGLLYREKVDGKVLYKAIPLLHGIIEFNVNRHTKEQVKAWTKIASGGGGLRGRYYKYEPFQRSLPIRPEAVKDGDLLPEDDIRNILKSAKTIAVANCICRTIAKQLGGDCKYPMRTCMAVNGWADYYVENGDGEYITYEEAVRILDMSDELGLSVHCANSKETEIICCCCKCCCGIIKGYNLFPENHAVPNTSNYRMVLDHEKCIDCGACVERCVMDALKVEDGKLRYNPDVCNGCGLCVTKCPEKAVILERKPHTYLPQGQTWFDTYQIMAQDRRTCGDL